ncbi:ABC transporter ATP-binding protein [Patescibacteria group bacterium]|nr:ABC transporter ATP-binding protein [Patescibacteria group bacterium]
MKTTPDTAPKPASFLAAIKKLASLLTGDKSRILLALGSVIVTSLLNLAAPLAFGYAVDHYIQSNQYQGVLAVSAVLLIVFIIAFAFNYLQMRLMGGVGQSVLFRLRNNVFQKLQDLPIAFFHAHKAGDLISRINNDTDKLNQFFSETLVRFIGSIFIIGGAAVFIVVLNPRLGLAALLPAAGLFLFTQLTSGWIKRRTSGSLRSIGALSGEIQESLENFKVIVAFNRRDYFRERFEEANQENFLASFRAGTATGLYSPVYDFAGSFAQIIVVSYGLVLVSQGSLSVGLLLSFLIYIDRFYAPLKQIAMLWSSLQLATAAWDRVSEVLADPSELPMMPSVAVSKTNAILAFEDVSFGYTPEKTILSHLSFSLEAGKTYALVGPTGGGKTTTASLMARLYDPTEGCITLEGKDIRSYGDEERTARVGFILQEPFLFSGTLLENIFYGSKEATTSSLEEKTKQLSAAGFDHLLARFEGGLEQVIVPGGDVMSLGQRQLIAFMRAVLRKPDVLILDEATANIDTVTEQLLEEVLRALPAQTTKVIIAHRLNTIENADEIFFVNGGAVTPAGSLEHAISLLMEGKKQS